MDGKKGFLFFVIILISSVFIISLLSSQSLDSLEKQVEGVQENLDKAQEIADSPWDYLRAEWEKLFLKNPVVSKLDGFFKEFSIVFRILFGMNYEFSIVLFGIIVLWVLVIFNSGKLITSTGFFDGGASQILGIGVAILFAQVGILKSITIFAGNIIFSPENAWTRAILFFIFVILLGVFTYLSDMLSKYIEGVKEAAKKHASELSQKAVKKFSETFSKTSSAK